MKLNVSKIGIAIVVACASLAFAGLEVSTAQTGLPNPILGSMGQEFYKEGGKEYVRYKLMVHNNEIYPDQLFAAAPDLPPCGTIANSSRTWVDIYDQRGKRLGGSCTLKNNDGLTQLWFGLEKDVIPPSWVYIEIHDRKTNTKYKSNLAETTE